MKRSFSSYEHIVFDWNGTVVDDVHLALRSVNRVRADFGLPPIDLTTYRRHFQFPIAEFYAALGFDLAKTPFAQLMDHYLGYFDAEIAQCPLCPGFDDLARSLKLAKVGLSVLSASHQKTLLRTARHNGIASLVDNLFGLEDSAAAGKLARARELDRLLRRHSSTRILMIGDTEHDHVVANDRGWDFVAVASGHQCRRKLEQLGVPVLASLAAVQAAGPDNPSQRAADS